MAEQSDVDFVVNMLKEGLDDDGILAVGRSLLASLGSKVQFTSYDRDDILAAIEGHYYSEEIAAWGERAEEEIVRHVLNSIIWRTYLFDGDNTPYEYIEDAISNACDELGYAKYPPGHDDEDDDD